LQELLEERELGDRNEVFKLLMNKEIKIMGKILCLNMFDVPPHLLMENGMGG